MAVCSLFNRMLLLTDLIPVHLVYCGQTVMIGCNHTSFEWTRAVRHIYGIIRHMQGLYINSPWNCYMQAMPWAMCGAMCKRGWGWGGERQKYKISLGKGVLPPGPPWSGQ